MNKVKCDHCHLEFDEEVMIKEIDHHFCCNGCQGVFHLLSDSGLDGFYEKVGDTKLAPPSEDFEDSTNFDVPSFYERFVKKNSDGFSEVSLIIEGIHCAACVWLNEKALHKMNGVIDAHINYTNNKAKIIWSDGVVKLSKIIDMIRAIGYNAYPYDPSIQEVRANKERKDYYLRMAVATFATMNMMWVAIAQYAGYFTGIEQDIKTILNVAEWVLATPALFYSGWVFYRGAYYGLKNSIINMDLLVATGATLTYFYSIYITFLEQGEAYFDSVSMIITFVLLGKFLETLSKKNTADTLDIMSKSIPSEVSVIVGNTIVMKNINDVIVGDHIFLKVGERAVLDGEVYDGEANFDESSLSGENEPINKKKGSKIISGTTNIDGVIKYRATKDFASSTLATIVSLLESAMSKKPRIEQLANRLSEHFSKTILLSALITFIAWYFYPHSFNTSFMVAISVIIIACPCALALATPVATLVGFSMAIKKGILFKEASQLESMAEVDVLVLDKTGTLTHGKPSVVGAQYYKEINPDIIYSLAKSSKHPISEGISRYLQEQNGDIKLYILDSIEQVQARGVKAIFEGKVIIGGNGTFMSDHGISVDESGDFSHFFVSFDGEVVAKFTLRDELKADGAHAIKIIQEMGIETIILSGDHSKSVSLVAHEVGIAKFYAHMKPQDKENFIQELQKSGKKVVMVGDGVNDILALARAQIGIAMGNGSDIAIEVSDVVLLNNSLSTLAHAFKISKLTYRLIKQNIGISLIYNSITIPLAMAGYVIPLLAAISMSFSSLLVVGNSMRIKISK